MRSSCSPASQPSFSAVPVQFAIDGLVRKRFGARTTTNRGPEFILPDLTKPDPVVNFKKKEEMAFVYGRK